MMCRDEEHVDVELTDSGEVEPDLEVSSVEAAPNELSGWRRIEKKGSPEQNDNAKLLDKKSNKGKLVGKSEFANYSYFKSLNEHPLLSKDQEAEFAKSRNGGDRQAVNKLVVSNLRLVVKFAKKFRNRGIDFDDLIQEGNLGLIRAAELYDPKKGTRFSTYASMWILQSLSRAVDKYSRTVKLPASMQLDIRSIYRCIEVNKVLSGREPTEEEIAKTTNLPLDRVKEAMFYVSTSVSLNKKIFDEGNSELGDTIPQYANEDMEKSTERYFQDKEVQSLLSCLTDEERAVIIHRFGLQDTEVLSFESLAELYGKDITSIRNAQRRALKRMKRYKTSLKINRPIDEDKIGQFAL